MNETSGTGIIHPELFCTYLACPCHRDDSRWAEVGDALADGRIRDDQAADVIDGLLPLPKAA